MDDNRKQPRGLLDLATELTVFHGAELGTQLLERLESWLRETLARPSCSVAVVAFVPQTQRSLIAVSSKGSEDGLAFLRSFSMGLVEGPAARSARTLPSSSEALLETGRTRGIAVPIYLPEQDRLRGHLFVMDDEAFDADDLETLRFAAQYLALIVNPERERRDWIQIMGRFRHALLGPVQGLSSAARLLAKRAEGIASDSVVAHLTALIHRETESIRLWRENQRFYMTDSVVISRRRFSLRSLIERCSDRYAPIAAARHNKIETVLAFRGEMTVNADEVAIDLALSNLLDNACKYSYFNQVICIGASPVKQAVRLWVEDVGHSFPLGPSSESQKEEGNQRRVQKDPFRVIEGQGIGLAMVLRVVRAHNARFTHTCVRAFEGRTPATTGYRVRFSIDLPQ